MFPFPYSDVDVFRSATFTSGFRAPLPLPRGVKVDAPFDVGTPSLEGAMDLIFALGADGGGGRRGRGADGICKEDHERKSGQEG